MKIQNLLIPAAIIGIGCFIIKNFSKSSSETPVFGAAQQPIINISTGEKVKTEDIGKSNYNDLSSSPDWVKTAGGKLPQIIPTKWDSRSIVVAAANQFLSKPLTTSQENLAVAINQKFGSFNKAGLRI